MGLNQAIDINAEDLRTVLALLNQHLPGTAAWVYGSRAQWTSMPQSDLDLVVFATPEQAARVGALREAFEESNLAFRVDLFVWDDVPETFKDQIETEHVVLIGADDRIRENRGPSVLSEWVECRLADGCSSIDYGLTASATNVTVGPQFLRITDIVSGHIDWNTVPHVSVDEATTRKYQLNDGDIVIARTGASTGTSCYVDSPPRAVFASYLVRLKTKREFDSRFIAYYLKSGDFRAFIQGVLGDKSAQPNASASTMAQAPLRIPRDIGDQRAIAHILATLDDKIELNRRLNETLEAMAQALFKSWFVDFDPVRAKMNGRWRSSESSPGLPAEHYDLFPDRLVPSELGEIPEGWKVKALGEVIEIYDSRRVPLNSRQRANRQGSYPYYGAAGIMDYVDDYLFDGVYVLTGEDGSVINGDGHPVVQYIWGQFWVNNHAHVLKGTNDLSEEHLYLLLRQLNILSFVTGAVQPKLSQRNLKAVPIVFPDRSVSSAFSGLIGPLFEGLRDSADESETLATLRDALLSKLLSGEMRVRDADRLRTGEAL